MTTTPSGAAGTQHGAAQSADLNALLFPTRDPNLEVVTSSRLTRVGARPPFATYLRMIWQRRHFLWAEARAKVASGSRETLLGQAWLVLTPVLDGLVFFVMFGLVLRANQGVENFVGFLLIGVFLFGFASRCITNGSNAISAGKNLIKAFQFPRASLPIAVVLREVLNLGITLLALGLLLLAIPPTENWTWRVALIVPTLALLIVFVTGIALFMARLCAAVPDIHRVISLVMRMLMWGSGVMFPLTRFENQPGLLAVVRANPLFIAIDMTRAAVLHGVTPPPSQWLAMTAWAVGTFTIGLVFFWHAEESYGRA